MFAQLKVHRSCATGEIEAFDANVRVHFSAVSGSDAGEFVHNASHPADRHFPFSSAVANEVIKKAAVLEQRRIVRVCEQANLAIGKDNAAQQIVLQVSFNHKTERFFDQAAPGLSREVILSKLPCEFLFATK